MSAAISVILLHNKRIDASLTQGLTQTFKQASYVLITFASVKKGNADNKFLTQFKGNGLTLKKIGLVEKTIVFIFIMTTSQIVQAQLLLCLCICPSN